MPSETPTPRQVPPHTVGSSYICHRCEKSHVVGCGADATVNGRPCPNDTPTPQAGELRMIDQDIADREEAFIALEASDPVATWHTDSIASMLSAFADDQPISKVGDAMREAAKRLRAPALVAPSAVPADKIDEIRFAAETCTQAGADENGPTPEWLRAGFLADTVAPMLRRYADLLARASIPGGEQDAAELLARYEQAMMRQAAPASSFAYETACRDLRALRPPLLARLRASAPAEPRELPGDEELQALATVARIMSGSMYPGDHRTGVLLSSLLARLRAEPRELTEDAKDAERWRALGWIIEDEGLRTPEPGAVILWWQPSNDYDNAHASIQAVAWRAPTRTLWIYEGETIAEALEAAAADITGPQTADDTRLTSREPVQEVGNG